MSGDGAQTPDADAPEAATAENTEAEGTEAKAPSRLQAILVEYGAIGIIVLLSLSALTYVGFALAFLVGFEVNTAGGATGALGAAAAGWFLTKPFRIPAAIALTPIVATIWRRVRGRTQ